jgi:hypothetical protein
MKKGWDWYVTRVGAFVFLAALLGFTLYVTSRKGTTNTESGLWTFILFAIGIAATFYFGRQSVKAAATDLIKPQAGSAGRRLITLGRGMNSIRAVLRVHRNAARQAAEVNDGVVPIESVELTCSTLEIQIDQQMSSVLDALEDWRQFDPSIENKFEDYAEE